jgi:C-terminal processing protease CtpA/Prc
MDAFIAQLTLLLRVGPALALVLFLSCSENKAIEAQPQDYVGVGVELTMEAAGARVVRTLQNSPAERAKLVAGDVILEVERESLRGVKLVDAVKKLRGPAGSTIHVLVRTSAGNKIYPIVRKPVQNK